MIQLNEIFSKLLDFIYKKRCYFCGSNKECVKMCSKCYEELCYSDINANRIIMGADVYSAGVYEKYLQKMIRGVKYHNQKELAYYMAKFMWKYFELICDKNKIEKDFQVVAVPLHPSRQKKRRYNHMELVASEFCNLSGFTPNFELIKRIKNTKPQYKLSRAEKIENLKNAFRVDKTKSLNKPVLILDDICTSGATFSSMIEEFHKEGINNIICLAASSPMY